MKDPENNQKKEHTDDDILEGKNDVLRAKDIIPATPVPVQMDDSPAPLPEQKDTGIPKLDLDEKIMAQQRKISSVKRKAPAQSDKPHKDMELRSKSYIFNQSTLTTAEENRLITQIVARDIKQLSQEK